MRHALVAALILLAVLTSAAQTRQKVSLELGTVTVWLGMPKADVLSACAAAGYTVRESKDSGTLMIMSAASPGPNVRLYSVQFKAGRVSYADRHWNPSGEDFDAVIGALATLDGKDCVVSHQPLNTPDTKLNRVFIRCGPRSVLITKGKMVDIAAADVFERIGEYE